MAEPEEESAPPKILVRAPNGDLWLIKKNATPQLVHSDDPEKQQQDQGLLQILNNTETALVNHFLSSANPGVKVGITVVDFDYDGQY
jgi:hypothetical protein